jgi:hypothetical protein
MLATAGYFDNAYNCSSLQYTSVYTTEYPNSTVLSTASGTKVVDTLLQGKEAERKPSKTYILEDRILFIREQNIKIDTLKNSVYSSRIT